MKKIVFMVALGILFIPMCYGQTDQNDSVSVNDSIILKELVVTSKRPTYIQSIDRKVFNVGTDIASSSSSLGDLMRNIPSVQVDIDGNVSLRGSSNVMILIDGKPSIMLKGANRSTLLQQMPSNNIEKIEVITNPSAQYKPDGTAGIINLITKKGKKQSLVGTIVANIGNKQRYNVGASLEYSVGKFAFSANYNYRHDRRDRYTYNDRYLTDASKGSSTYISQYTLTKAPSTSHIIGAGIQWTPTAKDKLYTSVGFTHMTFPRNEDNWLSQTDNNTVTKKYDRNRYDFETQNENEIAMGYTHTFTKDKTLTVDYTHSYFGEIERNRYTNIFSIPSSYQTMDSTLIKQKEYENLIRAIYDVKTDNYHLVAGYEAELDKADMRYLAEDYIGSSWVKNTDKSNDYIFNEHVHSVYSTVEHPFGPLDIMLGIRGELSLIKSQLLTLNENVKDNYFMVYPTLHTTYDIGYNSQLQLNYSLRVNRPEGDDLNPFPEYQDPYNVKAGNPYLKPEKIHSVELGWQWKQDATTLIFTPYYRYTFNKITEITQDLGNGIMKTTKQNMSSSKASGAELIFNSAVRNWLSYNLSSNLFYNIIDASDLGYSKNKNAWGWEISLNANLAPISNLMVQLNTHYKSSILTPQGKSLSTYIMNLGAKYEIPKYNLSFVSTVSDLFDTFKNVTEIKTANINQCIERRRNPRTFYFGIIYKFGTTGNKKSNNTKLQYDEGL
jgi:outer membrane receptor for ferrienterochelin and colicin